MSVAWHDQRGSAAAEVTLLVPAVLAVLLFMVFCGRLAEARLQVNDAAHQAARAATLARTPAQADAEARTATADALAHAGASCRGQSVRNELGELRPGQTVTVTVTCQVATADLTGLHIPGTLNITAASPSVVDFWRGETRGGNP